MRSRDLADSGARRIPAVLRHLSAQGRHRRPLRPEASSQRSSERSRPRSHENPVKIHGFRCKSHQKSIKTKWKTWKIMKNHEELSKTVRKNVSAARDFSRVADIANPYLVISPIVGIFNQQVGLRPAAMSASKNTVNVLPPCNPSRAPLLTNSNWFKLI